MTKRNPKQLKGGKCPGLSNQKEAAREEPGGNQRGSLGGTLGKRRKREFSPSFALWCGTEFPPLSWDSARTFLKAFGSSGDALGCKDFTAEGRKLCLPTSLKDGMMKMMLCWGILGLPNPAVLSWPPLPRPRLPKPPAPGTLEFCPVPGKARKNRALKESKLNHPSLWLGIN